jgi:hypothetical protein
MVRPGLGCLILPIAAAKPRLPRRTITLVG